eukprot:1584276-Pleurochrysis_carterae.AAC.1
MLGPSSARLGARSLVMGRVDAAAALACPLNLPAGRRSPSPTRAHAYTHAHTRILTHACEWAIARSTLHRPAR